MTVKEKMTAPIASVGADVEQPSSNKSSIVIQDSIPAILDKCKS